MAWITNYWFFLSWRAPAAWQCTEVIDRQPAQSLALPFSINPYQKLDRLAVLSAGNSSPRHMKAVGELSCQKLIWFFLGNYGKVMAVFRDDWLFCQPPSSRRFHPGEETGKVIAGVWDRFILQLNNALHWSLRSSCSGRGQTKWINSLGSKTGLF